LAQTDRAANDHANQTAVCRLLTLDDNGRQ
jgi:hypothetical protein